MLQCIAAAHAHARSVEQTALRSIAHYCTALTASDEGAQDKYTQKKLHGRSGHALKATRINSVNVRGGDGRGGHALKSTRINSVNVRGGDGRGGHALHVPAAETQDPVVATKRIFAHVAAGRS